MLLCVQQPLRASGSVTSRCRLCKQVSAVLLVTLLALTTHHDPPPCFNDPIKGELMAGNHSEMAELAAGAMIIAEKGSNSHWTRF